MLDPDKTLAIILGVSHCPRAENLQPLPQCKNSADDFHAYLRTTLGLPKSNIINLFDSPGYASEQLDKIEDWLAGDAGSKFSNLFVYYSGHGGFTRNDRAYFLAVQRTRSGSEGATSIRYVDLASSIKRHADSLRKYLILDCCFAASAVLQTQTDLGQLVLSRVEDELPPSGTAVLCSSAAKLVSIAPAGERHTMFSGAFLQCLKDGVSGGNHFLTFEDVGKRTQQIIRERFPNDAVRPELHVPDQHRGNPSKVPLFPNVSWSPPSEGTTTEQPEALRSPRGSTATARWRTLPTEAWLGMASGILAAVLARYLPMPLGGDVERDFFVPPFSPALCLTATLIVTAMLAKRPLSLRASILFAISIYVAWAAAWESVVLLVLYVINSPNPDTAALTVSPLAGFIGAFLVGVFAQIQFSGWRSLGQKCRDATAPALLLSAVGFLSFAATKFFSQGLITLPFYLAVFVPWHAAVSMMFKWTGRETDRSHIPRLQVQKLSRRNVALAGAALAGYLFMICFVVGFVVQELKITFSDLPVVFTVTDTAVTKTGDTYEIQVKYQSAKTIPTDIECRMEVAAGNEPFGVDSTAKDVNSYFGRETSTFSVKPDQFEDLKVRLNCSGSRLSNYQSEWTYLGVNKP